jgi:hypothetical protein
MFQSWSVEPVMKKKNVTVTHIVCISYLLTVVKYSLVCDSDTVWNVPLYGQAELIASIVFACHSLSVWGNTALNYLCCVTCSRSNINMYGQAELIASIVFACHSLNVWGNTALNYLCCVTCSRNNINMYISFMLHFLLLVVFGTQVTLMQLGFCGQKWMIYSVSAVIMVSFRKVNFFEQFEAFKPVRVKLFVHLYSL